MKKNLIEEVERIKELSSINEQKKLLTEGELNELIADLIKLFKIASEELKQTEIYKKLLSFYEKLISGELPFQISNSIGSSLTSVPEKAKTISSDDDDFYKEILSGIGAPWNDVNKLLMYSWRRAEGADCRNNPFNTTLKLNNTTQKCASHGEKHYETKDDGITATIKTLENGKYQGIIDALKNSDPNEFFKYLEDSPWGTNSELVKQIYDDYISGVSNRPPTPIG